MRSATEMNLYIDGVNGNFNFIANRYPNDKVLLEKLKYLSLYAFQLGALAGGDKDALKKLTEKFREDRYKDGNY